MNEFGFIAENIYHLKREYGCAATIGREITNVDTVTGNKNRIITNSVDVSRVILLPFNWRKFFAQGKEKGGVSSVGMQEILVDRRDIDFEPKHGDFIKTKGHTRDIKTVEIYPESYVITVVAIDGMQNVRP